MAVKHLLLAAIALLPFAACNSGSDTGNDHKTSLQQSTESPAPAAKNEPLTEGEGDDSAGNYVDSFEVQMESMLHLKIKLPPAYYHDVTSANDEAIAKFTQLANVLNGKVKILVNSSMLVGELTGTIKAASVKESDLLLLIDKTYSMKGDIARVKEGLTQIIDTIKKYKGTRLAIAFYGDKNVDGMGWYTFRNFETNYDSAKQYLEEVKVYGGGDIPESVYEAAIKSMDQDFWKSKKKCNMILVGDAPPLEQPLSDYTINDVISKARAGKIRMNFYPIIITPEIKEVKLPPSEVEKYKEVKLTTSLYPNPTRGHIDVGFEETGTYYMELYNMSGAMILTEEFFGISWGKDLGDIPNGMYILRAINADHRYEVMKFILQR